MTRDELEAVIAQANIGPRTAKKLRSALEAIETGAPGKDSKTHKIPRGHGAPEQNSTPLVSI
ncbi:MAG TPA: hypothetical protein VFN31_01005 [Candidatus Saccharimonadales bacterium]|nr:hypothetical protein [Candidatus Saccharimonadales bacterium]